MLMIFPTADGYPANRFFAIPITGAAYLLTSGGSLFRPRATEVSIAPQTPPDIIPVMTAAALGSRESNEFRRVC